MRQLQSEAYALRLMRKIHRDHPDKNGNGSPHAGILYRASENVASYARQAVAYAAAADSAPMEVKPVVRYYQMLHTVKTLLYLFQLDFPSSTSVLQHGLSVRRIKRSGYRWPLEKLTVHKEGIIQSFHHLFSQKPLPEKLLVGDLIGSLPQLSGILGQFYDHLEHAYPLYTNSSQMPTMGPPESVHVEVRQSKTQDQMAQGQTAQVQRDQTDPMESMDKHLDTNEETTESLTQIDDLGESASHAATVDKTASSNGVQKTQRARSTGTPPVRITAQRSRAWVSRRIASNQGMTVDEWKQAYLNAGPVNHVGTEIPQDANTGSSTMMGQVERAHDSRYVQGHEPASSAPPGANSSLLVSSEANRKGYLNIPLPTPNHPWFNSYDGVDYLVDEPAYPVYLVQYGLLFCLSALSRYSATEWSDIIHWNNEQDALLVREYLRLPCPRPIVRLDIPITPQSIEWIADGRIVND
ncbi:hypothetical protein GI364_00065 [Alicyclobacillus sp. SO9]|nr:hypothetical protein GI364_00065 [Alicyclobacillus sp. SO9]